MWRVIQLILLATVAVAVASGEATAQKRHFDPAKTYRVPISAGQTLGPDDALVTVVEFSDFYCGYCRRANETLRRLMHLYPNELRLVFLHSPLDPEDGTLASEASLAAAAQGHFWPMHDRIFAGSRGANRATLERYARELGLDMSRFREDLDARNQLGLLRANIRVAAGLGVTSTPTFFINGRPLMGARGLGSFVRLIEEELVRARKAVKAGVPKRDLYGAIYETGEEKGSEAPVAQPGAVGIDDGTRYPVGLGMKSHAVGPTDALVTIVEYSDLQCPYCRRALGTVNEIRKAYGDRVRIIYRHLPLPSHSRAQLAAEATVEAGLQGKFWSYHELLLNSQSALTRPDLERYAERLGIDMKKFRASLDRRSHQSAVLRDYAEGAKLGVTGTPTFFINGVAMVGAQPFSQFKIAIDAELAYAKKLVAGGVARKDLYAHVISTSEPSVPVVGLAAAKAETVELDEVDYHLAVLIACRQGDRDRANTFFAEVKNKLRRRLLLQDCGKMGVKLSKSGKKKKK